MTLRLPCFVSLRRDYPVTLYQRDLPLECIVVNNNEVIMIVSHYHLDISLQDFLHCIAAQVVE